MNRSRPRRLRATPRRSGLLAALLLLPLLAVAPLSTPASAAVATAPTITGITYSGSDATVSFTQGSDGGSAITNYEYSIGSGAFTPLSPVDATSPITLSGIASNQSIRIKAINADGSSKASNAFLIPFTVEYLVVAGGGAGGPRIGGGGGAGGMLEGSTTVSASTTTVTVGAGGSSCVAACSGTGTSGQSGGNSVFGSVTAHGGGGGGSKFANGLAGGSGGGPGHASVTGGAGSAGEGSNGSPFNSTGAPNYGAGGGGGKSAAGTIGTDNQAGVGGAGQASSITGTSVTYAGGGTAGRKGSGTGLAGGAGGGGQGGTDTVACLPGTDGKGGGGGGRGGDFTVAGCDGGNGIVVARYFGAQQATGGTVTTAGGYTIHTFTASGTFTKTAPVLPAAPTITADRTPAPNADGWNNEPVTVSFTCESDFLTSCSQPTTLSTDSASHSVTGTATDVYNQSTSATVSPVKIDTVAPTIAGAATTPANGAGWHNAPVTVAWSCSDALSGIAPGACPANQVVSGEGAAVTVGASVTDRAGNMGTGTSQTLKIDLTPPSTGVSSAPTWSTADVPVTFSPADGLSGVASTTYEIDGGPTQTGTSAVVSGEGSHTVTYRSTDVAGNVEATNTTTINIDTEAPSISGSVSPAANANGWNNTPVTVSFTCGDSASGVASCTPDQTLSSETDTTVTGTAVDNVGHTASASVTVRIDLSAPTGAAQVPPANADGWFNAPVQVPFTCADTGGSGVASCPAPVMIAGEGAGQSVTGTVTDNAGNTAAVTPGTVSLDTTAPTISGAAQEPMNPNGGYTGTVHVHWTCDDTLSGVAACPADETVTGEGVHTVTASVTDRAGNTSTASVTIRIDADTSNDPGTIHGIVRDDVTGQPLAGIKVGLYLPVTSVTAYTTTTGTDGSYTFPMVADGTYNLAGTKWGTYLQTWYPQVFSATPAERIVVAHGTNKTADLDMVPGHVLSGTVTSSTGGPIGGATVVLSNGYSAVTDATGAYSIAGLPNGNNIGLTYVAYGYDTVTTTVNINTSSTRDQVLTPSPVGPGIKGTITKAGSRPVNLGTVRIYAKNARSFSATAVTGTDGRYQLPAVPAGVYQVEVVSGSGPARWANDASSRSTATVLTIGAGCTSTPDASWGDPCATPVNINIP